MKNKSNFFKKIDFLFPFLFLLSFSQFGLSFFFFFLSLTLPLIRFSLISHCPSKSIEELDEKKKKAKKNWTYQSTTRGIRRARKKEKIDGNRQVRFHFRFELLVWYCWIVGRMGLLLGPG